MREVVRRIFDAVDGSQMEWEDAQVTGAVRERLMGWRRRVADGVNEMMDEVYDVAHFPGPPICVMS